MRSTENFTSSQRSKNFSRPATSRRVERHRRGRRIHIRAARAASRRHRNGHDRWCRCGQLALSGRTPVVYDIRPAKIALGAERTGTDLHRSEADAKAALRFALASTHNGPSCWRGDATTTEEALGYSM